MHKSQSPLDLAQIFEPVRDDLARVDQEFLRHVQSRVQLIPQIGRYIQTSGGKRVRPAVLLMAARMAGYHGDGDRAVLYASVVEFIHTATLVHDDIIDESDLRRGRLAVHSRWGNDITVLLGDYLYIKSMALALTQDSLEIIRLLCDVTLRMIEGELFQLTKTGDVDHQRRRAFRDHPAQDRASVRGLRADRRHARRCVARTQSRRCGTTASTSGSPSSSSTICSTTRPMSRRWASRLAAISARARSRLPIIHLLERAGRRRPGDRRGDCPRSRRDTGGVGRAEADAARLAGRISSATRQADHYASLAQQQLSFFPPSLERDALMSLPEYVIARDR